MIYCCGRYHDASQVLLLESDYNYKNRKLELLYCPICGKLSAVLTQYNVNLQKTETYRPKPKKTAKFLLKIQEGKWKEEKIPFGTKEKAGFVYGLNKQHKDGKIFQYSVDFNNQKKLVKIVG